MNNFLKNFLIGNFILAIMLSVLVGLTLLAEYHFRICVLLGILTIGTLIGFDINKE